MSDGAEKNDGPDVEVRPIPEFPDYYAGRDGSVWSHAVRFGTHGRPTWRRLKATKTDHGYLVVAMRKGAERKRGGRTLTRYVHRLILEAFVGPCPPGMVTCHGNDDGTDNRVENLRWDTNKGNRRDAFDNGTAPVGQRGGGARLTDEDVRVIRYMIGRGIPKERVAVAFNVGYSCIVQIHRGKTWEHLLD